MDRKVDTKMKDYNPVIWKRRDVEEVIKDAEAIARRTGQVQYVGAIGFPDGSQIYGDGTLGHTPDVDLICGLGTLFATCEPERTIRHL